MDIIEFIETYTNIYIHREPFTGCVMYKIYMKMYKREDRNLSGSSFVFFGLHTFEVIKGFIHGYLTLKEKIRLHQSVQAHTGAYKCLIAAYTLR